jgi:5-methylcytosine-specific restriction endonuclease McrA
MASQYHTGGSWINPISRLAIYIRDGFTCAYCGRDLRTFKPAYVTLDHLVPRSKWVGPSEEVNDPGNLVTACKSCNSSRGNKELLDFAPGGSLERIAHLIVQPLNLDLARAIIAGTCGDPRLENR